MKILSAVFELLRIHRQTDISVTHYILKHIINFKREVNIVRLYTVILNYMKALLILVDINFQDCQV
jgi:hypothetical protein